MPTHTTTAQDRAHEFDFDKGLEDGDVNEVLQNAQELQDAVTYLDRLVVEKHADIESLTAELNEVREELSNLRDAQ